MRQKQLELKDVSREKLLAFIEEEGDYKAGIYLSVPWRILRRGQGGKSDLFFLCGYIGLSENNKYFDVHYDQIPANVHGGLTYASQHLYLQPEKDLWWIGFDCAHARDVSSWIPDKEIFAPRWHYESYKTMNYVEREIKKLIRQIK